MMNNHFAMELNLDELEMAAGGNGLLDWRNKLIEIVMDDIKRDLENQ